MRRLLVILLSASLTLSALAFPVVAAATAWQVKDRAGNVVGSVTDAGSVYDRSGIKVGFLQRESYDAVAGDVVKAQYCSLNCHSVLSSSKRAQEEQRWRAPRRHFPRERGSPIT